MLWATLHIIIHWRLVPHCNTVQHQAPRTPIKILVICVPCSSHRCNMWCSHFCHRSSLLSFTTLEVLSSTIFGQGELPYESFTSFLQKTCA
ncbi:hypothetical protein M758_7G088500 [Ceratodon purpureus]|nr:hypothetical protein M758_7G088500 [Ceratodon purpureus]